MSYIERHVVTITTDASGDATGYTPAITGKINAIVYIKDDYATGVDFIITVEGTAQNVWTEANVNASKTIAPRQATHSEAGVASLYAGSGEPVEDKITVANDRIKIVIDEGGDTLTGTFHVIME